jgi:hypothetical protein
MIVIGDKESEVDFSRSAGAATIKITSDGVDGVDGVGVPGATRPDFVAATLLEAAQIIISRRR